MARTSHKRQQKGQSSRKSGSHAKQNTSSGNTSIAAPNSVPGAVVIQGNKRRLLTIQEVDLLRRTVAKGTSDDEFGLFLWFCRNHQVDPVAQEVYCIMRWDSKRDIVGQDENGKPIYQGGNKMTLQMGIGGLRGLAARKHKDYGSTDEPVWVFENRKTPAGRRVPEQVTVAVWKKGAERPTRATIFWDEFAPKAVMDRDTAWKHEFWNNSPANQLAKCCEAQALRKSYPDLNNIYIPEEMARTESDYTSEGRQIVTADGTAPSGRPITYEAQQRTAAALDENAVHGHAPGSEKAKQAEAVEAKMAALNTPEAIARVKEEERLANERNRARKPQEEASKSKPPIDVKPYQAAPQAARAPISGPTLEVQEVSANDFVIMGNVEPVLPMIQRYCQWGKDSFWHTNAAGVGTMLELQGSIGGFSLKVPARRSFSTTSANAGEKDKPATQTKPADRRSPKPPVAPELVSGLIAKVSMGMTSRNAPTRQVQINKVWFTSYVHPIFEFLDKGVGREAEVWVDERKNIVGLKKVGKTEFDVDGRTPVMPLDREPGTPGLFK